MDIKKYLKKYDILEKTIVIDNINYDYIEAKYEYNGNQYAKFYILDFINHLEYEQYAKQWEDCERFWDFQRNLLEDEFFKCVGDTRFNLYLVFVLPATSSLFTNVKIQKDFKYARKILLEEQNVGPFFDELFQLYRTKSSKNAVGIDKRKAILDRLRDSNAQARGFLEHTFNLYFYIFGNTKKQRQYDMLRKPLVISNYIDECLKTEIKRKKSQLKNGTSSCDYQVQRIESVSIKNYRCFTGPVDIPFRKVNLIYGENGVGKTSLLEAIELGVTGLNRKNDSTNEKEVEVEVKCRDSKNQIKIMKSQKDNYKLAANWYGIKIESCEEFNKMFSKCNYFDTSWASSFAIDGQNQVELLKKFLDVDDIECAQDFLVKLYKEIIIISQENLRMIRKRQNNIFRSKKTFKGISENEKIELAICKTIALCENELKELTDDTENVTLQDILSNHIRKIESIYKLLISTNEYDMLKVNDGEIVAVRSGNHEIVSMSKMSTGQKVCLALAVMFALFLSYDFAPNIIMLDEPVANLDDLHMLNLLDVLRRFAISDTQIFFTTANPDVARMFRRKFSFLEKDFGSYTVSESESELKIIYEDYLPDKEEPVSSRIIK